MREKEINTEWIDRKKWGKKIKLQAQKDVKNLETLYISKMKIKIENTA